jgi:hypothetical protein
LLKRVALILQNNCREADFVARMGGDEFVLMFSGARRNELQSRIDNLGRLIRRACYDLCGADSIGLSVGIACYPEDGSEPDTLLSHSHREMYRAKTTHKAYGELPKLAPRDSHRVLSCPEHSSAESPFCQLFSLNRDIGSMGHTDTAQHPVSLKWEDPGAIPAIVESTPGVLSKERIS